MPISLTQEQREKYAAAFNSVKGRLPGEQYFSVMLRDGKLIIDRVEALIKADPQHAEDYIRTLNIMATDRDCKAARYRDDEITLETIRTFVTDEQKEKLDEGGYDPDKFSKHFSRFLALNASNRDNLDRLIQNLEAVACNAKTFKEAGVIQEDLEHLIVFAQPDTIRACAMRAADFSAAGFNGKQIVGLISFGTRSASTLNAVADVAKELSVTIGYEPLHIMLAGYYGNLELPENISPQAAIEANVKAIHAGAKKAQHLKEAGMNGWEIAVSIARGKTELPIEMQKQQAGKVLNELKEIAGSVAVNGSHLLLG